MTADGDGLAVGEVARRLGISVTTLRTWHQRYGLGPSHHIAGRHRRYTGDDLARLEAMCRFTSLGVPAAQAARLALNLPEVAESAGEERAELPDQAPSRAGGGRAIPVGRAGPAARGLARAAARLDAQSMVELIAADIHAHGVVSAWDQLICPVLVGIGSRHTDDRGFVAIEHMLSRSVSEAFAAVPRPVSDTLTRVLLSCADEEQHSLPLEALAAALAERGHSSRLLGARVPSQALTEAVRRTGPAAVVVWSHASHTADPAQLRAILDLRPPPPVLAAAGPGWAAQPLPLGTEQPTNLAAALAILLPVLAGVRPPAPPAGQGWPRRTASTLAVRARRAPGR